MRRLLFLPMVAACAHGPTEKPILVTPDLLENLSIAMPDEAQIQVEDGDCDEYDRTRVRASFEELRTSLLEHGFTLAEDGEANLRLAHTNTITSCTYDDMIHGTSTVVLTDRWGRTVEAVSLFPLWADGLVRQLLESAALASFAAHPPEPPQAAPPPPSPPQAPKTPPAFSPTPLASEVLEPALAKQLGGYLAARIADAGYRRSDDGAPLTSEVTKLGSKCVLTARLGGRSATERTSCDADALAGAIDRITPRLTTSSR